MLYLLTVDPGEGTGVALLNEDGTIVWALTCTAPFAELSSALSQYPEAQVVYEDAPDTRHHQATFQTILGLILEHPRTPVPVRPSQWKGHPASTLSREDKKSLDTKHEREAVSLGRWYLSQRRTDAHPDPSGAHA